MFMNVELVSLTLVRAPTSSAQLPSVCAQSDIYFYYFIREVCVKYMYINRQPKNGACSLLYVDDD